MGRRLLDLQKGLTEIAELAYQGYTNHVLAVVAPLEDCERRGRRRESAKGKRYEPREFEHSVAALAPMIAACNGTYKVARPTELDGDDRRLGLEEILSGCNAAQAAAGS